MFRRPIPGHPCLRRSADGRVTQTLARLAQLSSSFFRPSCLLPTTLTVLFLVSMTPPAFAAEAETIDSVAIWINAFIPREIKGVTTALTTGPHAGKTVIPGPVPRISDCFLTDQRSFSDDVSASVRMQSRIDVDLLARKHHGTPSTSGTTEVDCEDGEGEWTGRADLSRMTSYDFRVTRDSEQETVITIKFAHAAQDPAFVHTPSAVVADIDYDGTLTLVRSERGCKLEVSFDGHIDSFPAFEMYAAIPSMPPQEIFHAAPPTGHTPRDLFGTANTPVTGSTTFITCSLSGSGHISGTRLVQGTSRPGSQRSGTYAQTVTLEKLVSGPEDWSVGIRVINLFAQSDQEKVLPAYLFVADWSWKYSDTEVTRDGTRIVRRGSGTVKLPVTVWIDKDAGTYGIAVTDAAGYDGGDSPTSIAGHGGSLPSEYLYLIDQCLHCAFETGTQVVTYKGPPAYSETRGDSEFPWVTMLQGSIDNSQPRILTGTRTARPPAQPAGDDDLYTFTWTINLDELLAPKPTTQEPGPLEPVEPGPTEPMDDVA